MAAKLMIDFDEAMWRIAEIAKPIATESVPLDAAARRVIASPVRAQVDSPRSDVSAMDGYAVREADLATLPARLKVAGVSFAGTGWTGHIDAGGCARIFTGAPVPAGADRVVIQETVTRDGDHAIISEHPGDARHIRKRGSDFVSGKELLSPGQLLHPRALVAAAAADVPQVDVFTQPWVSVLSTGDELATPGDAARSKESVPESVSYGVAALADSWGGMIVARHCLRDDVDAMEQVAADAVITSDVIVVTGGASVGEMDFAKAMFGQLGLDIVFSKVAIKPGKPVWLGRVRDAIVVGLPGNPTSALVTARLFLAPLLAGMSGRRPQDALRWRRVPLASPLGECGARESFHRARAHGELAEILSFQDSSAQKTLAEADLLVRQRAGSPASAIGEMVEVLDF